MDEPEKPAATDASPERTPDGGRVGRAPGLLRQAVFGSEQDFTKGPLGRAIFLLAVPMVLEMLMESLFGVVNVFWVASLGAEAVAAVGLTESMLTIVFTVALGLSMATTATVARRIGEKNPEAASRAAAQSILLGSAVAVCIGVIGIIFAPQLLQLMGAEESVVAVGANYPRIIYGSNIVIMLLFLNNAVFRGAGDASIAMRALWIANAVNLVLDPCFIFGWGPFPELGVTGSAVATTIGRGAGVVYQFWMMTSGRGRVTVSFRSLTPDFPLMASLLRLSVGGMLQFLVATASWVALIRIVAYFGSAALAGYTVAVRIFVFAILPSWGMSNAAATLVGQSLGAGKPERAERAVWKTAFANMLFLLGVSLVFIIFAEQLVGIFTTDPAVVPYGVDCLRFISYGYVFYAYGMVIVQSFNGAGDTFTPTVINIICLWLVQLPLAYYLSMRAGMGARGVFFAITIAESLLAVVAVLVFRRGKWKERKV
ncbi:MAG TPA: MATE family efflux transporter [Pyrinomonadaceae bacterium]